MDYSNDPYIFVKSGEEIVYKMSRMTWSNFSYFKMIVYDHMQKENPSNIIEIECIDDIEDFWKFLKNDFPKEKIDFSLNVKTICITFGIIDNKNIFWGRLRELLTKAALEYFHKMETNLLVYPINYTYDDFSKHMTSRRIKQVSVIRKFQEITLEDPRCLDDF